VSVRPKEDKISPRIKVDRPLNRLEGDIIALPNKRNIRVCQKNHANKSWKFVYLGSQRGMSINLGRMRQTNLLGKRGGHLRGSRKKTASVGVIRRRKRRSGSARKRIKNPSLERRASWNACRRRMKTRKGEPSKGDAWSGPETHL